MLLQTRAEEPLRHALRATARQQSPTLVITMERYAGAPVNLVGGGALPCVITRAWPSCVVVLKVRSDAQKNEYRHRAGTPINCKDSVKVFRLAIRVWSGQCGAYFFTSSP